MELSVYLELVRHISYSISTLIQKGEQIVCYDLSPQAVNNALAGKHKIPPCKDLKVQKGSAIAPSSTVETTTDTSKGILCECVKVC